MSLSTMLDQYFAQRPDLRSRRAQKAALARHVIPTLGATTVTELRRRQITLMLDQVAVEAGPVMANRVLAYLRAPLNWYEARTDDWRSPIVKGMMRRAGVEGTRVLDNNELCKVWAATADGSPFSRLIRVLLLTGQRRCEVSEMPWAELSPADALWTIRAARYKSGVAHRVPLPAQVLALLGEPQGGPYVFSTTGGRLSVSGFGKALASLQARSGTDGWRLHDLRRTVRTRMAGLRVPQAVAELVLGHGKRGMARVYDQHSYLPEMREALEAWAAELERIVRQGP